MHRAGVESVDAVEAVRSLRIVAVVTETKKVKLISLHFAVLYACGAPRSPPEHRIYQLGVQSGGTT